jgi:hypothetical protein
MKKLSLLIGLITILNSCFEQGDCTDVSSNMIKIKFYDFVSRAPKSIALDSITINNETSLSFYEGETVSTVQLPLHPDLDSIKFNLYFGNSVSVLDVQYKIRTFALAPDCLAIDLYSITDATGVTINQIVFKQKELSKDVPENLQLYF